VTSTTQFTPEFVTNIPDDLMPGVLYVSIPYATAQHLCACGCGHQVSTPLSPIDWKLVYDGETVSLRPSIGNWSFPCRSHYFIDRNQVRWSVRWTQREIDENRHRAREATTRAPQQSATHDDAAKASPRVLTPRQWIQRFRSSKHRKR
jgi:hypothetical protein